MLELTEYDVKVLVRFWSYAEYVFVFAAFFQISRFFAWLIKVMKGCAFSADNVLNWLLPSIASSAAILVLLAARALCAHGYYGWGIFCIALASFPVGAFVFMGLMESLEKYSSDLRIYSNVEKKVWLIDRVGGLLFFSFVFLPLRSSPLWIVPACILIHYGNNVPN
ncbi:MAG: hypothetical protein IKW49_01690 [Opitutales bacterium]|nr:hypothetical protein [Opitutales bacterium]